MDKLHLSDRAEIGRAAAGTPIEPIEARKVTPCISPLPGLTTPDRAQTVTGWNRAVCRVA